MPGKLRALQLFALMITTLTVTGLQPLKSNRNFVNPSRSYQSLVGNPSLVYSSYFGGSRDETGTAIAVDSRGYIYIAGTTNSADLPVTAGAAQPVYGGGDDNGDGDGFVVKLSPAGSLVYATYLGGSSYESITGIAVDPMGNAYVTGYTRSNKFPRTAGALRGKGTGFVTKLNATGTAILYSTRGIGGVAIAVDASGNAYLTGSVRQSDFSPTSGAFQSSFGGGQADAFVAKLDARGKSLLYATYLGGRGTEVATSITADAAGNAYIAGHIDFFSANGEKEFPTTAGVLYEKNPIGSPSAFVSKVNADGSALVYSTYLNVQTAYGLAIDPEGNAYVTGKTSSIPVTEGAFQKVFGGNCCYIPSQWDFGAGDAYALKLNANASALSYATFLGGGSPDGGIAIAVDPSGNAYVTGFADSTNFPTENPLQIAGRGLLKSTDAGATWSRASNGLNAADVKVLAIDPVDSATLYVGSQVGIFKSTDAGNSWNAINNGLFSGAQSYQPEINVTALVIDRSHPSTLYTATTNGIYKSTDGGSNWVGIRNRFSRILAIDPLAPTTIYGATDKLMKSTDGGQTWNDLDFGLVERVAFVNSLTIDPTNPLTIYASVTLQSTTPESINVIKSTDGGNSWSKTSKGPGGDSPLIVDPQNPSTIYMERYKSLNGGNTWSPSGWAGAYISAQALAPSTPSTLYLGAVENYPTAAGVFKSTDGGFNWQATSLQHATIYVLGIDPKDAATIYAGTSLSSDAFIAKLNSTGSRLEYSTYFGGFGNDQGRAIAVDRFGNIYVTGETLSDNLLTVNPLQAHLGSGMHAFIAMLGSPREAIQPKITGASVVHNTLSVFGEDFDFGAVLLVNDEEQSNTANDPSTPATTLIAPKLGKRIKPGETVRLRVRNLDGVLSSEFRFTR